MYGTVLPCECEGHFQNYPALPVAIIANYFIKLGMLLFKNYTLQKFTKIIVINASLNAYKLAFSGKEVWLFYNEYVKLSTKNSLKRLKYIYLCLVTLNQ